MKKDTVKEIHSALKEGAKAFIFTAVVIVVILFFFISGEMKKDSHTNKYGTNLSVCSHVGCTRKIANSGDTNCCIIHSNKCHECNCYIDEDAFMCMDCIESFLS